MTDTASHEKLRALDTDLRERAAAVIPGGMYGHMSVGRLPPAYPQFYERSEGTRVWDVDGNEYVDFHNGYGAMAVGHAHPRIAEVVSERVRLGTHFAQPTEDSIIVADNLSERFGQPLGQ